MGLVFHFGRATYPACRWIIGAGQASRAKLRNSRSGGSASRYRVNAVRSQLATDFYADQPFPATPAGSPIAISVAACVRPCPGHSPKMLAASLGRFSRVAQNVLFTTRVVHDENRATRSTNESMMTRLKRISRHQPARTCGFTDALAVDSQSFAFPVESKPGLSLVPKHSCDSG
jgi:hypothetical protein